MVKTFANIWLHVPEPPGSNSLVSNHTTLFTTQRDDSNDKIPVVGDKGTIESETSFYDNTTSPKILRENELFKSACLHIVNDCITKLKILISFDYPKIGNISYTPFVYKTLEERFGVVAGKNFDNAVIGARYSDSHKIQRDIKDIISVLKELLDEIHIFSAATCVDSFLEAYYKMKDDEIQLLQTFERRKCIFKSLINEVKYDRENTVKLFKDMDVRLNQETVNLKDLMSDWKGSINYTKNWELSRAEQNSIVLKNQENMFWNNYHGKIESMRLEDICHEQINRYCEETKDELVNDIEHWMEVYDKEYEEKDTEIYNMKKAIDKTMDEKDKLQQTYEEREKAMADWLEYKRKKKEEEERVILEYWTAVKIQAWWRGEMVRKRLGPFAKKKKKGKSGKKNGNKNKKKK